jgi:site-specific DNA-methyltransferase (adenine-specific)
MWKEVKRINKGVFVTTASQPFTSKIVMSNIENFKYEWIWNKKLAGNALNSNYQPLKIHENIIVFSYSNTTFNMLKTKGMMRTKMWNGSFPKGTNGEQKEIKAYQSDEYKPTTILEFSLARTGREHPTQKPVALYEYLIRTYTNEGDTVLDFTCGSGTTGVACVNTNRNCILIDKDQHWIDVSAKRVKDAQQQMRLF